MIRLEITADNPADFLARLGYVADAFLPRSVVDVPSTFATQPESEPTADPSPPMAEPVGDVTKLEPEKKRGRKKAEAPIIDAVAEPQPEVQPEGPKFEIDHLRKRTKEIVDVGQKAGKSMSDAMAPVMKLFGDLGIAKLSELAADRYAEFMQKSDALLPQAA